MEKNIANLPLCSLCEQPFDTFGNTCQICLTKNFDAESGTVLAPTTQQSVVADSSPSDQTLQDVAEIYRKDNVFLNNLTVLTGQEAASMDIEHESFVYNNVLKDSNGNLYPDWNLRGQNHIANLKKLIETYRVKEGSTRRALALTRAAELEKLSPAERDAWKKSLDKPARTSSAETVIKTEKKKQTLLEKQIEGLLKLGLAADSPMVLQLKALQK